MPAKKSSAAMTYEAMFLLSSGAAADIDGATAIVRGMIEKHGGKIAVIKKWDERKLAYEVGGQKRGLYIITYFKAPGAAIAALEREVTLSDQILRVLVTKADHLNQKEMEKVEPQPIQPREERPSWDRPFSDRPPRDDRGGDRGGDRGADRGGDRGGDRGDRGPERSAAPAPAAAPRAPRKEPVVSDAGANKD